MKFYANILEEIKQASNYDKMSMIFPKDHVEVIEQIMDGAKSVEFNGNVLSNSQINNIRKAIEDESALRGSFIMMNGWNHKFLNIKMFKKEQLTRRYQGK